MESHRCSLLDLSPVLQQDLKTFNNPDLINSEESFDYLLQLVCDELIKAPSSINNKQSVLKEIQGHRSLSKFRATQVNQWFGSLATFLIKAAGENSSFSEVEDCLVRLGWTHQHVKKLSKFYESNLFRIRAMLKLVGNTPPKLVDIKWRLDVQMESSIRGQLDELWYMIDLTLEEQGVQQTTTFTASHAQLEDLVVTFKDAYNSAKRFAST